MYPVLAVRDRSSVKGDLSQDAHTNIGGSVPLANSRMVMILDRFEPNVKPAVYRGVLPYAVVGKDVSIERLR